MKIGFYGAARMVTGSKHLITHKSGEQLLLDCGMFQGQGEQTDRLNRHFGFDPMQVNHLILSHAHIDHSGLIPMLVKQGFAGPIYCTPATFDIVTLLLLDSAHIQEADTRYINKQRGTKTPKELLKPLYNTEDVNRALQLFVQVPLNTTYTINENFSFFFSEAGHIIGSAAVNVVVREDGRTYNLLFTGDVGRYNDELLPSPKSPEYQADYIICESTYGDTKHENIDNSVKVLAQIIQQTCIEKQGKLIIPAFSLGRTQEILYYLNQMKNNKQIPDLKVFVDSPLSTKTTQTVMKHKACFNKTLRKLMEKDPNPFDFEGLTFIEEKEESQRLNQSKEPCIIISASGMADAGRVKHHIAHAIENPKNTILLVGYCEPASLGGRLMRGAERTKIFGIEYSVKAQIEVLRGFSAHADYDDLCQFLSLQDPQAVKQFFVVHGEYEVQQTFKERLIRKGFADVTIPEKDKVYRLIKD
jgi:metallo-beta-lactamase family protein